MMKMTWLKLGLASVLSTCVLAACVKKEQPEHDAHAASEVQSAEEQAVVLQEQPQIEEIPTEEPSAQITLTEEPKATPSRDTTTPAAVEVVAPKAEDTPAATATTTHTSDEDPIAQALKAAQPALKPAQAPASAAE